MHRRRGPERSAALFVSTFTTSRQPPMGTTDVLIFDTTLRDGEQAPGNSLSPEEKLRLARQLDALGVDVIEAGFPAASEGDYRSVREIAAEIRRPVIAALARCTRARHRAGRRGAARRGARPDPRLHLHLRPAHPGEAPDSRGTRCWSGPARRSARRGSTPTTSSSPPRTPAAPTPTSSAGWSRRPSRRGPRTINLPDTVGYAMPAEYGAMFRDVLARVPGADRRRAERPLPRRPRPRGGQLAGRDRGRRAAGGVHGQRDRRAGRATRRWRSW